MSCITITGPMFAGKTTALINIIRGLRKHNSKILVFKHSIDVRYEPNHLCSHDKDKEECHPIMNALQIFENEKYVDSEVIIIEEVQFFDSEIIEAVDRIKSDGKKIIVSGLSGSFLQKPIGFMSEIYPKSEKIIHLVATCHFCKDITKAPFTAKIKGNNSLIEVGSDIYKPVCHKHFKEYSTI